MHEVDLNMVRGLHCALVLVPCLIVIASQIERDAQLVLHSLLQEDYPRCSSVDFDNQRLVCEIWDASDEQELLGSQSCSADNRAGHGFVQGCPDGSLNRTCVLPWRSVILFKRMRRLWKNPKP